MATWIAGANVVNNASITIPATATIGALALIHFSGQGSSTAPAAPSGWTLARSDVTSGFSFVSAIYYKFLAAGDPGTSVTFSYGGSSSWMEIGTWSGVPSGTPGGSAAGSGRPTTSYTIPGQTVTTAVGDLVVELISLYNASTGGGQPATARVFNSTTLSVPIIGYLSDHTATTTSDTSPSTPTWNTPSGTASWVSQSIAFHTNTAPNAPTGLAPASNATVDRSVIQRLSWTFSDPDAGDSQSKFDLQWRQAGSGATWNTVTQTTPNSFYDAPANTFPAENVEWQVRTYDQSGAVGPYAALAYFIAANPATPPTITAPVSGGTVSSNPATVTWSASGQQGYQVRRVADNAGSPNTSIVYWDSGQVTDPTAPATRSLSVPFETNNRWEHVQVRIQQGGLWSAWSDVRVNVAYTPPAVPVLVAAADNSTASILVTVTNPSGTTTVTSNDIYMRKTGDTSAGIRIATGIAPNGSSRWYAPASGVAYQFLVRAVGSNSTTADSAWTS